MANEKFIWDYLSKYFNPYAVAGIMGNLYAESGLKPTNLQGTFEKKLGYTDDTYTAAVDNGRYNNFVKDQAGYGLAQWTYWTRKQNLLNFARSKNASIGDLEMQCEFLVKELKENYSKTCFNPLQTVKSVREASDIMLLKFERPANQSTSVQIKRASYGQKYYDQYATPQKAPMKEASIELIYLGSRTLRKGMEGNDVKELQQKLQELNYNSVGAADGKFGTKTKNAVKLFQKHSNLTVDGIFGPKSLVALKTRLLAI